MNKTYEYEERAFLTEKDFYRVKTILENESVSNSLDNKTCTLIKRW